MNMNSLQSLQQKQVFLRILIFSFATILVWVGFSLFLSQQQTGISPELQQLAKPLNPNIHLEVMNQIQQKRAFSDQELQGFPILRMIHNVNGQDTITLTPAGATTPTGATAPTVTTATVTTATGTAAPVGQ